MNKVMRIICIYLLLVMFPERLEAVDYGTILYLSDGFLRTIKTLAIPSYNLAEDFPEEHKKTFNDFLIFCASLEETSIQSKEPDISVVKARLELNSPVRYEDFLSAVPLSLSFVGHDNRIFEQRPQFMEHCVGLFRYPSRNSFFVENILEPLSRDLETEKYRGYRFKNKYLLQFFQQFIDLCYSYRYWLPRGWFNPINNSEASLIQAVEKVPEEFYLANYYAQTFLLVHNGKLREAYKEMYRYKIPLSILNNSPQLLPFRPYYLYGDEDRYLWFEYLQSELRSFGHIDFADNILGTEVEHYRELINWQLQLRVYLTQKLFEYGDNTNLSTLSELLTAEYVKLKNDSYFQVYYEKAINILRDIDDKVYSSSPIDTVKGNLLLSWIDREEIDRKQGIESEKHSVSPEVIDWNTAIESIDNETKNEMRKSYERSIYCIRTLSVITERIYNEKDLETMVQLHSKLANNKNVNYTPTGDIYQDLSALKNTYGDGADFPELDKQTRFDLRRYDLIANDFWGHQTRRKNGDKTVGDMYLPWVKVHNFDP